MKEKQVPLLSPRGEVTWSLKCGERVGVDWWAREEVWLRWSGHPLRHTVFRDHAL